MIGAHYDVAGEQDGADDNASGVSGLLELVRLTKEQNYRSAYSLEYVAYTLEEPPYFRTSSMGSAIHANSLKEVNAQLRLMISLEMIGYFSDDQDSQHYPLPFLKLFYPSSGNFISIIGKTDQVSLVYETKKLMSEGSNIDVRSFSPPNIIPGMDFSDHLNYWALNYPAIMITDTAFYRNQNYHTEEDTLEKLDFNRMSEVVRGVYWTVTHLN